MKDVEESYPSSLIKKRCRLDISIKVKLTTFNINDEERIEGRMEGERKGIIDTVRKCLKLRIPIEDVIKATGLSKVEIANL